MLTFLLCAVIEIPLSVMWGQHIDGTREAGKLFPTKQVMQLHNNSNDKLTNWAIKKWVSEQPNEAIFQNLSKRKSIPPGFVVSGIDKAALLAAKVVLCDGVSAEDTFSTQHELTLVFFTGGIHVFKLKPVIIDGNRIEVSYEAPKQHLQAMLTMPHFALIPLGKLPVGKYEVVIPDHELVCKSFSFEVRED